MLHLPVICAIRCLTRIGHRTWVPGIMGGRAFAQGWHSTGVAPFPNRHNARTIMLHHYRYFSNFLCLAILFALLGAALSGLAGCDFGPSQAQPAGAEGKGVATAT